MNYINNLNNETKFYIIMEIAPERSTWHIHSKVGHHAISKETLWEGGGVCINLTLWQGFQNHQDLRYDVMENIFLLGFLPFS